MDIVFKCPNCEQELEVDAGGAGSTLQCPSCSTTITVPTAESGEAAPAPPPPPPPPAEKHFSVPVHEAPAEALVHIQKASRPLEVVAKEGDKKMRIKTFKRSDCQEVGKDKFDEKVSEFLERVGQMNIVSVNTVSYSLVDMATHTTLQDYGVLIVFKG